MGICVELVSLVKYKRNDRSQISLNTRHHVNSFVLGEFGCVVTHPAVPAGAFSPFQMADTGNSRSKTIDNEWRCSAGEDFKESSEEKHNQLNNQLNECETSSLLSDFPPVAHAFAYGSAVFARQNYTPSEAAAAMTDLVFAVRDPRAWHEHNLRLHRHHYSSLGWLGPRAVATVQEGFGARVYYNAMVAWRGRTIKYGVVSIDALVDDLTCWSSLYLAGRMHKPVQTLSADSEVEAAARTNLRSAVGAALLMLPADFDEARLLTTLCSLSYSGDPRQALVEATKPRDIAASLAPELRAMYAAPLAEVVGLQAARARPLGDPGPLSELDGLLAPRDPSCPLSLRGPLSSVHWRAALAAGSSPELSSAGLRLEPSLHLEPSLRAREPLLAALPANAKAELTAALLRQLGDARPRGGPGTLGDTPLMDAARELYRRAGSAEHGMLQLGGSLRSSLGRVVQRSSTTQTLKGVLTGGAVTTVRYVTAKIAKQLRR